MTTPLYLKRPQCVGGPVVENSTLKQEVEKCQPVRGYLIMADLVGSTRSKWYENSSNPKPLRLKHWAANFIFPFTNLINNLDNTGLKTVGDMIMFWLPISSKPEEIMKSLCKVQEDHQSPATFRMVFLKCCMVYEVTFHSSVKHDVYGFEVDLAARLLSEAKPGEILINKSCWKAIASTPSDVRQIAFERRTFQKLKGIPKDIETYVWSLAVEQNSTISY